VQRSARSSPTPSICVSPGVRRQINRLSATYIPTARIRVSRIQDSKAATRFHPTTQHQAAVSRSRVCQKCHIVGVSRRAREPHIAIFELANPFVKFLAGAGRGEIRVIGVSISSAGFHHLLFLRCLLPTTRKLRLQTLLHPVNSHARIFPLSPLSPLNFDLSQGLSTFSFHHKTPSLSSSSRLPCLYRSLPTSARFYPLSLDAGLLVC
jgi:hypothetical protein